MVRFRIPDGRSVAEVVTALRSDRRVNSAQPNFRYHPHDRSPVVIGDIKNRAPRARQVKRPVSTAGAVDGRAAGKRSSLQRTGSLVADNQKSLQWPSADEPFVNVGNR